MAERWTPIRARLFDENEYNHILRSYMLSLRLGNAVVMSTVVHEHTEGLPLTRAHRTVLRGAVAEVIDKRDLRGIRVVPAQIESSGLLIESTLLVADSDLDPDSATTKVMNDVYLDVVDAANLSLEAMKYGYRWGWPVFPET
jgi:hypothetical protein